jgi:hypothetical protein
MTTSRPLPGFVGVLRTPDDDTSSKKQTTKHRFHNDQSEFYRSLTSSVTFAMAVMGITITVCAQDVFDFTYSDSDGDVANGQLTAGPNGDGSYTVTNGYIDGTAGSILGIYTLYLNPNAPDSYAYSPSGAFLYDNELFPSSDPILDNDGLLFTAGTIEVNLFGGDASGNITAGIYSLYDHDSTVEGYSVSHTGSATFDLTADPGANDVPEPRTGTLFLLAIGLAICVFFRG